VCLVQLSRVALNLSIFNLRWRMCAPPDAILAYRPGLHCPPWCRRRLVSVWRVCCPPLHVRILPVARRHTLCLRTGSYLSAPHLRGRGRRGVPAGDALWIGAPTALEELTVNFWYPLRRDKTVQLDYSHCLCDVQPLSYTFLTSPSLCCRFL
jgi:hypothetical protein